MFSNRLAVAVLGVGCLTAAAAGGFLAARQNSVPTPAAAQMQTAEAAPAVGAAAAKPVQETEAIVGDSAKPPAPAAAPEPALCRCQNLGNRFAQTAANSLSLCIYDALAFPRRGRAAVGSKLMGLTKKPIGRQPGARGGRSARR